MKELTKAQRPGVKVQKNSFFRKEFQQIAVVFFIYLSHSFSVVNILRGKSTSANLTEKSPLLRFSQDDGFVSVVFY